MTIEIVDFPSYKMVIFNSYVSLPEGITNDLKWYGLAFNSGHYHLYSFVINDGMMNGD